MNPPAWRFTAAASGDVERIIEDTLRAFGADQALRYASLIDSAARLCAEIPDRPSARQHDGLGPGVRSLHVGVAAQRPRSAAHTLFYRREAGGAVLILRVLHDRMDPTRHLDPSAQD